LKGKAHMFVLTIMLKRDNVDETNLAELLVE
jgi:hypothetical protein